MAPARFESHPVDPPTDVYSLACVLFECLTAQKPFAGDDLPALMYAHLYASPPRVSAVNPAVGAELDAVIAKGMAKKPTDRYPTTGALAAAARAALAASGERPSTSRRSPDASSPAPRTTPWPRVPSWRTGRGRCRHSRAAWGWAHWTTYAPTHGPEPRRDDPGAAPTIGVALEPEHAYSPGPPPGHPARRCRMARPGPHRAAPASRRTMVVLLAVVALLVAAAAGGAVWLLTRCSATPQAPGVGAPATDVPTGNGPTNVTAPAPVGRSIDKPTIGQTVDANPTPGYLQIAPNGRYAYIANREAGVLTIFDTTRNAKTGTISAPGAIRNVSHLTEARLRQHLQQPRTVNIVGVLDTTTSAFIATVPVGVRPFALDVSPDGKRVRANHDSGSISDRHCHQRRGRRDQGGAQPALG
jgi:serine/threonine-protein kinase